MSTYDILGNYLDSVKHEVQSHSDVVGHADNKEIEKSSSISHPLIIRSASTRIVNDIGYKAISTVDAHRTKPQLPQYSIDSSSEDKNYTAVNDVTKLQMRQGGYEEDAEYASGEDNTVQDPPVELERKLPKQSTGSDDVQQKFRRTQQRDHKVITTTRANPVSYNNVGDVEEEADYDFITNDELIANNLVFDDEDESEDQKFDAVSRSLSTVSSATAPPDDQHKYQTTITVPVDKSVVRIKLLEENVYSGNKKINTSEVIKRPDKTAVLNETIKVLSLEKEAISRKARALEERISLLSSNASTQEQHLQRYQERLQEEVEALRGVMEEQSEVIDVLRGRLSTQSCTHQGQITEFQNYITHTLEEYHKQNKFAADCQRINYRFELLETTLRRDIEDSANNEREAIYASTGASSERIREQRLVTYHNKHVGDITDFHLKQWSVRVLMTINFNEIKITALRNFYFQIFKEYFIINTEGVSRRAIDAECDIAFAENVASFTRKQVNFVDTLHQQLTNERKVHEEEVAHHVSLLQRAQKIESEVCSQLSFAEQTNMNLKITVQELQTQMTERTFSLQRALADVTTQLEAVKEQHGNSLKSLHITLDNRIEQEKKWAEECAVVKNEHERRITQMKSEIESRDAEIKLLNNQIQKFLMEIQLHEEGDNLSHERVQLLQATHEQQIVDLSNQQEKQLEEEIAKRLQDSEKHQSALDELTKEYTHTIVRLTEERDEAHEIVSRCKRDGCPGKVTDTIIEQYNQRLIDTEHEHQQQLRELRKEKYEEIIQQKNLHETEMVAAQDELDRLHCLLRDLELERTLLQKNMSALGDDSQVFEARRHLLEEISRMRSNTVVRGHKMIAEKEEEFRKELNRVQKEHETSLDYMNSAHKKDLEMKERATVKQIEILEYKLRDVTENLRCAESMLHRQLGAHNEAESNLERQIEQLQQQVEQLRSTTQHAASFSGRMSSSDQVENGDYLEGDTTEKEVKKAKEEETNNIIEELRKELKAKDRAVRVAQAQVSTCTDMLYELDVAVESINRRMSGGAIMENVLNDMDTQNRLRDTTKQKPHDVSSAEVGDLARIVQSLRISLQGNTAQMDIGRSPEHGGNTSGRVYMDALNKTPRIRNILEHSGSALFDKENHLAVAASEHLDVLRDEVTTWRRRYELLMEEHTAIVQAAEKEKKTLELQLRQEKEKPCDRCRQLRAVLAVADAAKKELVESNERLSQDREMLLVALQEAQQRQQSQQIQTQSTVPQMLSAVLDRLSDSDASVRNTQLVSQKVLHDVISRSQQQLTKDANITPNTFTTNTSDSSRNDDVINYVKHMDSPAVAATPHDDVIEAGDDNAIKLHIVEEEGDEPEARKMCEGDSSAYAAQEQEPFSNVSATNSTTMEHYSTTMRPNETSAVVVSAMSNMRSTEVADNESDTTETPDEATAHDVNTVLQRPPLYGARTEAILGDVWHMLSTTPYQQLSRHKQYLPSNSSQGRYDTISSVSAEDISSLGLSAIASSSSPQYRAIRVAQGTDQRDLNDDSTGINSLPTRVPPPTETRVGDNCSLDKTGAVIGVAGQFRYPVSDNRVYPAEFVASLHQHHASTLQHTSTERSNQETFFF